MKPRSALVLAAAIFYAVSHWVPNGQLLLYPLTLFVTWVHEMGHGLTALITGGTFSQLEIYSNAGGLAYAFASHGWPMALVCIGGLLGPPIFTCATLSFVRGPKRARIFLLSLAFALLASTAIWVRSKTGIIVVPALGILIGWLGWFAFREKPDHRVIVAHVLAVVAGIDTLTRMIHYVFVKEITMNGHSTPSDVGIITANVGGWYVLWGITLTIVACGLIAFGVWMAWREPKAATAKPAKAPPLTTPQKKSSSI
jgi:hypothetical protein